MSSQPSRGRPFRGPDSGYAIALTALILVPLLGFTALAVDLGSWYARASQVQRAADAAALAGVEALPRGTAQAIAAAHRVAEQNGFAHNGTTIIVDVEPLPPDQVRVTISDEEVPQYFSALLRDDDELVRVERSSLAEYIPPVRMGSPRNFLGTWFGTGASAGVPSGAEERFWLAISSPCSPVEDGDLRTARRRNTFTTWYGYRIFDGCSSGIANSDANYRSSGYYYGVSVPEDWNGGSLSIQAFDAPYCAGMSNSHELASSNDTSFTTRFRVYREGFETSPIASWTLEGKSADEDTSSLPGSHPCRSGGWQNAWRNLAPAFTPVPGATYIVQVDASDVEGDSRGPSNSFSLRAFGSTTGWQACTTDPSDSPVGYSEAAASSCPNVFAFEDLSVYTRFQPPGGAGLQSISWYLASIGPEHSGKTLQIDLFDPGEGASYIEVLNPLGDSVEFEWEVVRQLASENTPADGWSGTVSGPPGLPLNPYTGQPQIGSNRSANTFTYNERILRLRIDLPPNMAATPADGGFGSSTWWRVQYTGGSQSQNDRTTWSVTVYGDPVRLIQ